MARFTVEYETVDREYKIRVEVRARLLTEAQDKGRAKIMRIFGVDSSKIVFSYVDKKSLGCVVEIEESWTGITAHFHSCEVPGFNFPTVKKGKG